MAYFRILVGLRGCYSDSSENEIHEAADANALHEIITDRTNWHADTGEEADPTLDPCTLEQAQAVFDLYTRPNHPSLPTCAASWNGGTWGVLVSAATQDEFAITQLESSTSWEAPDGTTYFLAPKPMVAFVEYGEESGENFAECRKWFAGLCTEYSIPADAHHKVHTVSHDSDFSFESIHFLDYRGPADVLAYIPSLPNI